MRPQQLRKRRRDELQMSLFTFASGCVVNPDREFQCWRYVFTYFRLRLSGRSGPRRPGVTDAVRQSFHSRRPVLETLNPAVNCWQPMVNKYCFGGSSLGQLNAALEYPLFESISWLKKIFWGMWGRLFEFDLLVFENIHVHHAQLRELRLRKT